VFDFRRFLEGRLIKLPQRHEPAVFMTSEENRRFKSVISQRGEEVFSSDTPHGIMWANEGGGCVVPLPSVFFNGNTQTAEKPSQRPVVDRSYQLCGVDEEGHYRTYHGTYRCIRGVATDWEHLVSLDRKLAGQFLSRVVVGTGLAPPVFVSLIERLYKSGALKIDCFVLQFEHFDGATVKQVLSKECPTPNLKVPSRSGGKRPSDQQRGRAGGSSKRARMKN